MRRLQYYGTGQPVGVKGLLFARESDIQNGLDFLTVTLPSGRKLYYAKPFLAENDFGKEAIHYRAWIKQLKSGARFLLMVN
ncbi:hypothetical protein LSPH24S_00971 [Lysinibacillus sphaericus]